MIGERKQRAVPVGQLVRKLPGWNLTRQARGGGEDATEPAFQFINGQRGFGIVGELEELGDKAKIDPGNELPAPSNDRYAVRLQRIECRPRLLVVGDVPGNEVDRTGRQELLELEAAGSAGLPEDFNGGHSNWIR